MSKLEMNRFEEENETVGKSTLRKHHHFGIRFSLGRKRKINDEVCANTTASKCIPLYTCVLWSHKSYQIHLAQRHKHEHEHEHAHAHSTHRETEPIYILILLYCAAFSSIGFFLDKWKLLVFNLIFVQCMHSFIARCVFKQIYIYI